MEDTYYHTAEVKATPYPRKEMIKILTTMSTNEYLFTHRDAAGHLFGAVAIPTKQGGFLTTARGKHELDEISWVQSVDHDTLTVHAINRKATLNAPLLDNIFRRVPRTRTIIHYHEQYEGLPTLPWAPPGTVRDSDREVTGSFNIENHGCFLLLGEDCEQL